VTELSSCGSFKARASTLPWNWR